MFATVLCDLFHFICSTNICIIAMKLRIFVKNLRLSKMKNSIRMSLKGKKYDIHWIRIKPLNQILRGAEQHCGHKVQHFFSSLFNYRFRKNI